MDNCLLDSGQFLAKCRNVFLPISLEPYLFNTQRPVVTCAHVIMAAGRCFGLGCCRRWGERGFSFPNFVRGIILHVTP
jgi:hypothetical protein